MSYVYPHSSPIGSSTLPPAKVGMLAFLVTEAAFFGTLMMAYVFFLGQTGRGQPNPRQVFRLPIVLLASTCLLASSATIHQADRAMRGDSRSLFLGWWVQPSAWVWRFWPARRGNGVS